MGPLNKSEIRVDKLHNASLRSTYAVWQFQNCTVQLEILWNIITHVAASKCVKRVRVLGSMLLSEHSKQVPNKETYRKVLSRHLFYESTDSVAWEMS